jgi:hypothetical protein
MSSPEPDLEQALQSAEASLLALRQRYDQVQADRQRQGELALQQAAPGNRVSPRKRAIFLGQLENVFLANRAVHGPGASDWLARGVLCDSASGAEDGADRAAI